MITRNALKSWQRVKEILAAALDIEDEQERAAFLDAECAGDTRARRDIESLLAAEKKTENVFDEFSERSPVADLIDAAEEKGAARGVQIGAYRLTEEIGAGGMGVVYAAERTDGEFTQRVAVKLIRRGFDRETVALKFRRERQILASLNHPNIAQLHDGGTTTDGLPYLVMEYVEGVPVDEYCRRKNCSLEERLKLFRRICAAVSFAHQNLIVHRDLKPSNILVGADGAPKLLDFGVAKILESGGSGNQTLTENQVFTPAYASPEQIRGEASGTSADVYSLGVILYELLTGQTPYRTKTKSPLELARAIAEQEPTAPSRINAERGTRNAELKIENQKPKTEDQKQTPRSAFRVPHSKDLDAITLKALEKNPARRYASVEQFSEDARRYLEGLPVLARPNNRRYRAAKFARRNRLAVASAAAIFLILVAGIVATSYQTVVARRERALAEKRFSDVRKLSGSFLFEFHDAIENLSGATPARKLVVSRALEYLNNLSAESAGDDASLQNELAEAYRRLGEIQGHPSFSNLGDVKGSIESFTRARDIGARLVRDNPADKEYRFNLANYDDMLGDMMERAVYDTPAALRFYTASLDLRRALLAEDENDSRFLNALSLSDERVGNIRAKTGDLAGALAAYGEGLKINERLLALDPNSRQYRRGNYLSHYDIGNLLLADGKYADALAHYERGRALAEAMRAENASDAEFPRMLGYFDDLMSRAASALGDAPQASERASRALAVREKLFAEDPTNIKVVGDLTVSLDTMGEIEADAGNFADALLKLRRSLAMREAALAADPSMTIALRFSAISRNKIGKVLLKQKDARGALDEFQKALDANKNLCAKDAANLDLRRELADSYANAGAALDALAGDAKEPSENARLRGEAVEMKRGALEILTEMKRDDIFFGADAPRLEQLSRDLGVVVAAQLTAAK